MSQEFCTIKVLQTGGEGGVTEEPMDPEEKWRSERLDPVLAPTASEREPSTAFRLSPVLVLLTCLPRGQAPEPPRRAEQAAGLSVWPREGSGWAPWLPPHPEGAAH